MNYLQASSSQRRPISTRPTRRSTCQAHFRPSFELLEDRRVLSGGSFLNAPIIPVIDPAMLAHLTAIHAEGLRLGNQDSAFSKIGDSITASSNFLTEIGSPSYGLTDPSLLGSHVELAPTIAYFRSASVDGSGNNSFDHVSLAAGSGWMSQTLLTGLTGDTPLRRELASTRSSIALIMIGTNDAIAGIDPALFRFNLTLIADTAMSMGVIPVLSTIPDNMFLGGIFEPRVLALNQVIADVASQLDVPLWNYWQAAHGLSGLGVDVFGVHPSASPLGSGVFTDAGLLSGYNMRNFTALEVLREVKIQVLHVPDDFSIVLQDSAAPARAVPGGAAPIQVATAQLAAGPGVTYSVNAAPVQIVVGQLTGTALSSGSTLAAASLAGLLPPTAPQPVLELVGSGSGRLGTTKDLTKDAAAVLVPVEPKRSLKPEQLPSPTPVEEYGPEINPIGSPVLELAPDFQVPVGPLEPATPVAPFDYPSRGIGEKIVVAGLLVAWAGRLPALEDEDEEKEDGQ
jgi:hypothetical protein